MINNNNSNANMMTVHSSCFEILNLNIDLMKDHNSQWPTVRIILNINSSSSSEPFSNVL